MKIQINRQHETKTLTLKKETLRRLTSSELRLVAGGSARCMARDAQRQQ